MNAKGFTLLELIVTVVIFGIIAGMAFIGSKGLRDTISLKGAARQVYSDMQQARMKAIKEGKRLKVQFNGTSGEYEIMIIDADGNFLESVKNRDLGNDFAAVKIGCGPTDAIFNANGTANNGGVYLVLGGKTKRVYIRSSGTGAMQIKDEACP